jgi:hypothetical protein
MALVMARGRIEAGRKDKAYTKVRNNTDAARQPRAKGANSIRNNQGELCVTGWCGTIRGAGSVRFLGDGRDGRAEAARRLS